MFPGSIPETGRIGFLFCDDCCRRIPWRDRYCAYCGRENHEAPGWGPLLFWRGVVGLVLATSLVALPLVGLPLAIRILTS